MAEIAQIYLLPPPVRPTDRALASKAQVPEDGSLQPGAVANDQARARRFRFRVYESGEASDTGTELDTRRAGNNAALTASSIDLGNSDRLDSGSGFGGQGATRSKPNAASSSAFLAQSIAQEQLGEGLHNPPHAAAAAAYTRTGAALDPRRSAGLDISA